MKYKYGITWWDNSDYMCSSVADSEDELSEMLQRLQVGGIQPNDVTITVRVA